MAAPTAGSRDWVLTLCRAVTTCGLLALTLLMAEEGELVIAVSFGAMTALLATDTIRHGHRPLPQTRDVTP